jgi:hypothetical protein
MFLETVSALCYEIGDWHFADGDQTELSPPYNDVAEFVLEQWARMPDYLRQPMRAATIGFGLSAFVWGGRLYHRQELVRRRRQRMAWRSSALFAQRDLMRFYESLATLALYSRPIRRMAGRLGDTAERRVDSNGR